MEEYSMELLRYVFTCRDFHSGFYQNQNTEFKGEKKITKKKHIQILIKFQKWFDLFTELVDYIVSLDTWLKA